jgi:hypothetical protein
MVGRLESQTISGIDRITINAIDWIISITPAYNKRSNVIDVNVAPSGMKHIAFSELGAKRL